MKNGRDATLGGNYLDAVFLETVIDSSGSSWPRVPFSAWQMQVCSHQFVVQGCGYLDVTSQLQKSRGYKEHNGLEEPLLWTLFCSRNTLVCGHTCLSTHTCVHICMHIHAHANRNSMQVDLSTCVNFLNVSCLNFVQCQNIMFK